MNTQNYLEFTDLPAQLERKDIYNIFKPYSFVRKLYIHPTLRSGKIFLESKEKTEVAYAALNGVPPYYLKLSIKLSEDKFNYPSLNSPQEDALSPSNGTMNYCDNDSDDVMADIGPVLVNINGILVNTLTADDGEIYVPLSEVKELGFELFDPNYLPRKLNFETQLIKEFELYLTMKARKFMMRRGSKLSDGIIDATVQKLKHQAFSIKVTATNDSRNSSFVQNERKGNDRPKQFDNNKSEALVHDNKSLRKPHANKDGVQKRFGKDRERPSINNYERQGMSMGHNTSGNMENKSQSNAKNDKFENNSATRNNSPNFMLPGNTGIEKNELHIKSKAVDQSMVFKKTKPTYDQIELRLNAEIEVEITHVNSRNKCWVYQKNQRDVVQEILVQTNFKANETSAGQPVIGKICAADFLNAWYRVIILNTQPTLKVLYIDFGNKNTEQIKEIRDLPSSLTSIPGQAVGIIFDIPPSTLKVGMEMKVIPIKKLHDGTYVVTKAIEKKVNPILNELNAKASGTQFVVKSSKCEKEIDPNHSTGAIPKTTVFNSNKQKDNSPPPVLKAKKVRESVIESVGSEGNIQCTEVINDSTFLACILSSANFDELTSLENIGTNAKADKNYVANIGDLISVYYEKEDSWVRGLVTDVQNGKYTTALVDFAVVTQPVEFCALNKEYIDIPEFSCLCTCKPEVLNLMKKFQDQEIPCTIIEVGKLQLQFNNGETYVVHCEKWNPLITSKREKTVSPSLIFKTLQSSVKNKSVFTDPPRIKSIKQDDIVIIISNTSQKLLVRTKECNALFKSILEEISKLKSQPLKAPPVVNQIVLSTHESSIDLYRCIVKSVDNKMVEVDFIDYGYQDSVPLSNLREISESLARKESTLIPITLKSFENAEFNMAVLKELEEYCSSRVKFTVKATSKPGVFDLLNAKEENLSEQLSLLDRSSTPHTRELLFNSSVPSRLITYQKLTQPNLSLGSHELIYINMETLNEGKMVFIIADVKITERFLSLSDEINKLAATDDTPYSPRTNEICLALFEDAWFRAQMLAANETADLFDVYFIDFGNSHKVSSKNIRKMPEEFTMTPPVALNCVFQELATKEIKQQLFSRLQNLLGVDKLHTVEIIDIKDNIYTITIPSIVQTLKAEELL